MVSGNPAHQAMISCVCQKASCCWVHAGITIASLPLFSREGNEDARVEWHEVVVRGEAPAGCGGAIESLWQGKGFPHADGAANPGER